AAVWAVLAASISNKFVVAASVVAVFSSRILVKMTGLKLCKK
ncbi:8140_t:CDS:1, partial [Ambispora gerdemannii]